MQNTYPTFNPFETSTAPTAEPLPERTIDGVVARTDLPDDVSLFDPTSVGKHPHGRMLLPSAMDSLPVGEYAIGSPDSTDKFFDRNIVVTQDEDGTYIDGMYQALTDNLGNSRHLMAALGYKYDGKYGAATATPTPETIVRHAAKLGVEVQTFPEQGLIDSKDYLGAFAGGKYPISTGDAGYYAHDTQDDHITAMVLGGEPLKETLKIVAAKALEEGVDLDNYSMAIDLFTADLRGVVAPTYNDKDKDFAEHIRFVGRGLAIPDETIDHIIATATASAKGYGMETYA